MSDIVEDLRGKTLAVMGTYNYAYRLVEEQTNLITQRQYIELFGPAVARYWDRRNNIGYENRKRLGEMALSFCEGRLVVIDEITPHTPWHVETMVFFILHAEHYHARMHPVFQDFIDPVIIHYRKQINPFCDISACEGLDESYMVICE